MPPPSTSQNPSVERRIGTITHADLDDLIKGQEELRKLVASCHERISGGLKGSREGYQKLTDKVEASVKCGDERLTGHDSEIASILNKIQLFEIRLDDLVSQVNAKFSSLEYSVNTIGATAKSTEKAVESVNRSVTAVHDTLNIVLNDSLSNKSPSAAKPSKFDFLQKIPVAAWLVMGLVCIATLSAITGHMSEFFGWDISKIKGDG